jgi:hypothetical protein
VISVRLLLEVLRIESLHDGLMEIQIQAIEGAQDIDFFVPDAQPAVKNVDAAT